MRSSFTAASASSTWLAFVVPTIGAVTPGRLQQPGQRDLGGLHPAPGGHLGDRVHHVEVGLAVEAVTEGVGAGPGGEPLPVPGPVAGQHAAGQRAPRDHADALVDALRDHLPLFLAVEQVVVVLHGHERGPAVPVRRVLRLGELPGVHAARPDVAGLARLDHVVQCLHGLLDRGPRVPPVDLVEVHVVHVQAAQRVVDPGQDVLAGQAAVVLGVGHRAEHLGGNHDVLAPEQLAEQPPGDDLARAVGVGVGGVVEDHATVGRGLDERLRGVFLQHPLPAAPVAEAHHAEADAGHAQAGRAQVDVLHEHLSRNDPTSDATHACGCDGAPGAASYGTTSCQCRACPPRSRCGHPDPGCEPPRIDHRLGTGARTGPHPRGTGPPGRLTVMIVVVGTLTTFSCGRWHTDHIGPAQRGGGLG